MTHGSCADLNRKSEIRSETRQSVGALAARLQIRVMLVATRNISQKLAFLSTFRIITRFRFFKELILLIENIKLANQESGIRNQESAFNYI